MKLHLLNKAAIYHSCLIYIKKDLQLLHLLHNF